jgi:hypothetical protein
LPFASKAKPVTVLGCANARRVQKVKLLAHGAGDQRRRFGAGPTLGVLDPFHAEFLHYGGFAGLRGADQSAVIAAGQKILRLDVRRQAKYGAIMGGGGHPSAAADKP